MKAIGSTTKEIKKDMSVIVMAIPMKVISKKEKHMEKESIAGRMVKSMTENGAKELKMDMECGKVYLVTVIWGNGSILKLTVMGYINGKMEIDLKAAGTNV
jgi:hypothetical protein